MEAQGGYVCMYKCCSRSGGLNMNMLYSSSRVVGRTMQQQHNSTDHSQDGDNLQRFAIYSSAPFWCGEGGMEQVSMCIRPDPSLCVVTCPYIIYFYAFFFLLYFFLFLGRIIYAKYVRKIYRKYISLDKIHIASFTANPER